MKNGHCKTSTAKNTVISPNFLVWKFCGKAQSLHSFGRFAWSYVETASFHEISTPKNYVKLRFFSQWRNVDQPGNYGKMTSHSNLKLSAFKRPWGAHRGYLCLIAEVKILFSRICVWIWSSVSNIFPGKSS